MKPIKAITLWQPFASLWLSPAKVHETRHWPLKYRGWLAVHAAKTFEDSLSLEVSDILARIYGPRWPITLPRGAILGAVKVMACYRTEDVVRHYGGWSPAMHQGIR